MWSIHRYVNKSIAACLCQPNFLAVIFVSIKLLHYFNYIIYYFEEIVFGKMNIKC